MSVRHHEQDYAALMKFAFDQVCDPTDWKNPIDAIVQWEVANVYMQAVTFMTGTIANCERLKDRGGLCRITSEGYRAGPAGDH